ncbi:N-acetyltransferase family protein [Rhodoferax sp.]|uniref:GNAT family N-acetyltransferase n=1 Tax=Rhodoferax sp. TaxID=50421 RepID=UPI002747387A|nr:GNAT family N-acetyltransferase [Rhodoferax sp.]
MSKPARAAQGPKRPKKKLAALAPVASGEPVGAGLNVRPVRRGDLDAVIEIDAMVTGIEKRDYWNSLYRRYADAVATGQHFLVAVSDDEHVVGFVIGEVRDWEFGSPPCGWVFAIDVRPDARLGGTATRLLQAICAGFRRAGVSKVRTMLSRDNTLILSFFRSQGMMIGPFIPLEMDLES